jgi:hypothetical protein
VSPPSSDSSHRITLRPPPAQSIFEFKIVRIQNCSSHSKMKSIQLKHASGIHERSAATLCKGGTPIGSTQWHCLDSGAAHAWLWGKVHSGWQPPNSRILLSCPPIVSTLLWRDTRSSLVRQNIPIALLLLPHSPPNAHSLEKTTLPSLHRILSAEGTGA